MAKRSGPPARGRFKTLPMAGGGKKASLQAVTDTSISALCALMGLVDMAAQGGLLQMIRAGWDSQSTVSSATTIVEANRIGVGCLKQNVAVLRPGFDRYSEGVTMARGRKTSSVELMEPGGLLRRHVQVTRACCRSRSQRR